MFSLLGEDCKNDNGHVSGISKFISDMLFFCFLFLTFFLYCYDDEEDYYYISRLSILIYSGNYEADEERD